MAHCLEDRIAALRDFHTRFGASDSPFASAWRPSTPRRTTCALPLPPAPYYPQVERDRPFFVEPLEPGWSVQRYTLREHGVVIAGMEPQKLLDPVDPDEMRRDGAIIDTPGPIRRSATRPGWTGRVRGRIAPSSWRRSAACSTP